jgi:hypothetical protein
VAIEPALNPSASLEHALLPLLISRQYIHKREKAVLPSVHGSLHWFAPRGGDVACCCYLLGGDVARCYYLGSCCFRRGFKRVPAVHHDVQHDPAAPDVGDLSVVLPVPVDQYLWRHVCQRADLRAEGHSERGRSNLQRGRLVRGRRATSMYVNVPTWAGRLGWGWMHEPLRHDSKSASKTNHPHRPPASPTRIANCFGASQCLQAEQCP